MKKRMIACFAAFVLASSWGLMAQEAGYIKHRVNRGETVSKIARDYGISVSELLEHNPEAKKGIRESDFILIPNKKVEPVATTPNKKLQSVEVKTHVVEEKETIYSLTRKFKISVQNIYKWNPGLKENGLKVGETIYVSEDPSITALQEMLSGTSKKNEKPSKELDKLRYILKTVEPKETLYGIASQYKTTIQNLIALNPELANRELKIGEQIKVPEVFEKGIGKMETDQIRETLKGRVVKIAVEPKQTIYSITKEYNMTAEELLELNPDLRFGLKTGMELNVRVSGIESYDANKVLENDPITIDKETFSDLERSLVKSSTKELALLLPFNTK